jgi:bifunctional UDP-N-acetylglucosamine pyrophosphorylase/glucosamine-1-phosphate N-acetyltransferase
MRSSLPKVLHCLGGRPLIGHVLDAVAGLRPKAVHVVVGHQADQVKAAVGDSVNWVEQSEQRGTGHALGQALPHVDDASVVLMVYGDVPLVNPETLGEAATAAAEGALAIVTAEFDDPAELGRIVRDDSGAVRAIVEHADATPEQRRIREINSGLMALKAGAMKRLLAEIAPHNAQGEYYVTDIVGLAVAGGISVQAIEAQVPEEVAGVNDRVQLAALERYHQRRQAECLMRSGVTIADPDRVDFRGDVSAGEDCFIDVNVVLEGDVQLGCGVSIGAGCVIRDARLGDGVTIHPHTVIDGAIIGEHCEIGPFARLRPGTELDEEVKIGNFVETKKAHLGRGTKASHLTYLGDATLGEGCNVGAGTVTCNYDGISKYPTTIGDGVFVGTNSTLVAPLTIEDEAYIAAGSTITSTVEGGDLGVGRARQRNIKGWTRPDRRSR